MKVVHLRRAGKAHPWCTGQTSVAMTGDVGKATCSMCLEIRDAWVKKGVVDG